MRISQVKSEGGATTWPFEPNAMSAIAQAYSNANASERGDPVMRAMTMEEAPKVKAMRKDVESTVREGGCPTHRLAKKYSDSWFPGEISAETIGGCYQLHARRDSSAARGCLCLVCPLCLYQQKCSEDCVCLWPFLWGIPTALCCVVMPMCEREENGWVMRDKQGIRTGELLVVDKNDGTYACYSLKCCSTDFREEPDCMGKTFGKQVRIHQ